MMRSSLARAASTSARADQNLGERAASLSLAAQHKSGRCGSSGEVQGSHVVHQFGGQCHPRGTQKPLTCPGGHPSKLSARCCKLGLVEESRDAVHVEKKNRIIYTPLDGFDIVGNLQELAARPLPLYVVCTRAYPDTQVFGAAGDDALYERGGCNPPTSL